MPLEVFSLALVWIRLVARGLTFTLYKNPCSILFPRCVCVSTLQTASASFTLKKPNPSGNGAGGAGSFWVDFKLSKGGPKTWLPQKWTPEVLWVAWLLARANHVVEGSALARRHQSLKRRAIKSVGHLPFRSNFSVRVATCQDSWKTFIFHEGGPAFPGPQPAI